MRVLEEDEGAKDIELSDDPYDCMRLNVEHVPCIVTLSRVSIIYTNILQNLQLGENSGSLLFGSPKN